MAEQLDFSKFGVGDDEGPKKLDFAAFGSAEEAAPAKPAAEESSAWMRGFSNTLSRDNPEMLAETLEGLSYQVPEWMREGLRFNSGKLRELAGKTDKDLKLKAKDSIFDVRSIDEALTWLGENAGSAVASSIPSIITGTAGAVAGERVGGKLGGRAGALGGAFLGSYAMNYGETYKALKDAWGEHADLVDYRDPQSALKATQFDPELASQLALYATVPMAALDSIVPGETIAKLGGLKEVKRQAARGLLRRVLEEGGKGIGTEGLTGLLQESIKQATVSLETDKPFWTLDNTKQIVDAAIAEALGGPMAAAGGLRRDKVETTPGSNPPAPAGTPPQQPTGTPQAASQPIKTGTTTPPSQPAENVAVGNPKSAPTRSKKAYPKKGTGKPKAAPLVEGDVGVNGALDPAAAVALEATQPVKPAMAAAPDLAAAVETMAQQAPQPADRLEQDVIPPLPQPAPETEVSPPAEPAVTQQVTPPAQSVPLAQQPVLSLDPEVAQRENAPLSAVQEVQAPRVLPDLTQYAEPQLTNEEATANVKLAEAATTPKEVKGKNRTKAEKTARSGNNDIADTVVAVYPPHKDEQHLGKKGAKGVKARASVMDRARAMVAYAETNKFKQPRAFRSNTKKEENHSAHAILLAEAKALTSKKEVSDEDLAKFVETELMLRSGDEESINEVLRRRREEGDELFRKTQKGIETVAAPAATPTAETDEEAAAAEQATPVDEGVDEVRAEHIDKSASVTKSAKAGPQLFDEEKKPSEVRKVEITPELRAKYETPVAPKTPSQKALAEVIEDKARPQIKKHTPRVEELKSKVRKSKDQARRDKISEQASKLTGLPITIEYASGDTRTGRGEDGQPWSVQMPAHYGRIRRTEGADGEAVDVTVGSRLPNNDTVFIIDQKDAKTGKFDEHKVFLGFKHAQAVTETYAAQFSDGRGPDRFGGIRAMTLDEFKAWLKKDTPKPAVTQESKPAPAKKSKPTAAELEAEANRLLGEDILAERGTVGTRAMENINRNLSSPPKQWTPEAKRRFERRYERVENDEQLVQLVKDAAEYGVDWTHLLPEKPSWTEIEGNDFGLDRKLVAEVAKKVNAYGASADDHIVEIAEQYATQTLPVRVAAEKIKRVLRTAVGLGGPAKLARVLAPQMVDRISALIPDVKIYFVPPEVMKVLAGDESTNGFWSMSNNIIILRNNLDPRAQPHTALHEMVHAAFTKALWSNPRIRSIVGNIARQAATAMTKKELGEHSYAFSNVDEFVAEALSKPHLQELLANIPVDEELAAILETQRGRSIGRQIRTLWDALVSTVSEALGFGSAHNTLLDAMMHVGAELEFMASADIIGKLSRSEVNERRRLAGPAILADRSTYDYSKTVDRAGDHFAAAKAWAKRNVVKVLGLDQMAEQYAQTPYGDALRRISEAVNAEQPFMDKERRAYGAIAQEFADLAKDDVKEAAEMAEVMINAKQLEGNLVEGVDPKDIVTHPSNQHLGKDAMKGWQAKARLPELQRRFNALSPRARTLAKLMSDFYKAKHNEMVRLVVKNILESSKVWETLTDVEKLGVVKRTLDGKLTEDDKKALGKQLYNALSKEAELRTRRGIYVPEMRYGNHVVEGISKIKDTMGGKLISDDTVLFTDKSNTAARRAAQAFTEKSDLVALDHEHVFIDDTTGEIVSADEAKSLNDVSHGYTVKLQTRGLHLFESRAEAERFSRENPEGYDDISVAQHRLGDGYQAHTLSGTQVESLLSSIGIRDDLKEGEKRLLRTALTHAAARMMRGNRIAHRRLKGKSVTGASKDFARNLMNYGEAAGRHMIAARTMPIVRTAMKEMRDFLKGYMGKDKDLLVLIHDEIGARLDKGISNPQEPHQAMQDLLVLSYFTRLFSPAYSLINGLQPIMTTAPSLGGRFGNARAGLAITKAYSDMGFGDTLLSGVKNTAKAATGLWSRKGINSIDDLLTTVRDKLSKAADGADLLKLMDALVDNGVISSMAGFETNTATAYGRGLWGHSLVKVDRIARQMPLAIEVINRSVSGVASYRLARESGMTHEKAVEFTIKETNKTQGNYADANSPRFFKNPILRPWAQFKRYAHMYTYLVGDMTYRAFKDASPEERRVARKQLANVFAVQIAMAGTLGLPFLEVVKFGFMISSALGLSGGWDEQEEWLEGVAKDALGKNWGEYITRGFVRALGIDISTRVSAADMWLFGEPKDPGDTESVRAYLFNQAVGSAGDLVLDTVKALNDAAQGDFSKAFESVPIKALADAIKSANKGSGWGTFALNTFGLRTSEQVNETQKRIKGARQNTEWEKARKRLADSYSAARNAGERAKLRAQIIAHNKKAPVRFRVFYKGIDEHRRQPARLSPKDEETGERLFSQYYLINTFGENDGRRLWAEQNDINKITDRAVLDDRLAEIRIDAVRAKKQNDVLAYHAAQQIELWLVNRFNELSTAEWWEKNPREITDTDRAAVDAGMAAEELEARGVTKPPVPGKARWPNPTALRAR
jgi:hypothetical protein